MKMTALGMRHNVFGLKDTFDKALIWTTYTDHKGFRHPRSVCHHIEALRRIPNRCFHILTADNKKDGFLTSSCCVPLSLTSMKSSNAYLGDKAPAAADRTLYDVLCLTPKATHSEIKAAYYRLSMAFHPDKNSCNEAAVKRFHEISDAYNILGNYANRRKYDRGMIKNLSERSVGGNDDDQKDSSASFRQTQSRDFSFSNKRTSVTVNVGRTAAYNYDEWMRSHYGDCMKQHEAIKMHLDYLKTKKTDINRTRRIEMSLLIMSLFAFICYLLSGEDYDKTTSSPEQQQSQD